MTYCVAMKLEAGILFASDSRTNAGVDHVATFRKMQAFERAGERVLVLLSAGNLATTQSVISLLTEGTGLLSLPSLYEVAALIGEQCAVEVDLAAVDRFETVDRATQRRLAGARRTEKYHHLPGGDVEVDVAQHVQVAEMLVDVLQRDHRRGCHVRSP